MDPITKAIHIKYLAVNPVDLLWGVAVHTVGCQDIAPGMPGQPHSIPAPSKAGPAEQAQVSI